MAPGNQIARFLRLLELHLTHSEPVVDSYIAKVRD